MGTLEIALLMTGIVLIFLSILTFIILRALRNRLSNTEEILVTPEKTKSYLEDLNSMIQLISVYRFQSKVGKNVSVNMGAVNQLTNEEINTLKNDIEKEVIDTIDGDMKKYLFKAFGTKWLIKYIHIQVLSVVLTDASQYNG